MSLQPPAEGWYETPVARDERSWVAVATVVCLCLYVWMIGWHIYGRQNPSSISYRIEPAEYMQLHTAWVPRYQIGEENGVPVVAPPPGSDVFLLGQMWRWAPVLVLQKGQEYTFHLASVDLLHGFSLQPVNMNFMVYPGYDYVLRFRPTETGEFTVMCNEFCGIGHHMMTGRIYVVESAVELEQLRQRFQAPQQ